MIPYFMVWMLFLKCCEVTPWVGRMEKLWDFGDFTSIMQC